MSEFTKKVGEDDGESGIDTSALEQMPKDFNEFRSGINSTGEDGFNKTKAQAELGEYLNELKNRDDFDEDIEYSVPPKLLWAISPVLAKLDKDLYRIDYSEKGSKYLDDLDGLLRVNVGGGNFDDDEDFDDDARDNALYEARLRGIENYLEDEDSLDLYGEYGDGFSYFTGSYSVASEKEGDTRRLTYTRDILHEPKNVPMSMTAGLAEVLIEKLGESEK